MTPLSKLFKISYGHSLELNLLTPLSRDIGGIPFVSRKMGDNGISAFVAPIPGTAPAPAGELTCALSGNGVLATFLQEEPFYTGFHVARLSARVSLTREQLLFYAACITENRFRYSYGRQANRTLKDLLVPSVSDIPSFVSEVDLSVFEGSDRALSSGEPGDLNPAAWHKFRYDEVFIIKKGYYNKKPPTYDGVDKIPFIGATEYRNGVTSYVSPSDLKNFDKDGSQRGRDCLTKKIFPAKCVTISNNGSVGEAFYQGKAFTCSHDVNPIYLKDKSVDFSPEIGLFISAVIRADKYRWGYGRKWRPIRMPMSTIRLPVKDSGAPDWEFMERYVRVLPFSSKIDREP